MKYMPVFGVFLALVWPHGRGDESMEAAMAIVQEKSGEDSPDKGYCLGVRAALGREEDHLSEAETNFERSLDILRRKGKFLHFRSSGLPNTNSAVEESQALIADVLSDYAVCQTRRKNSRGAEESLRHAIEITEQAYGNTSSALIRLYYNLGEAYAQEKNLPAAERELKRAYVLAGRYTVTGASRMSARDRLEDKALAKAYAKTVKRRYTSELLTTKSWQARRFSLQKMGIVKKIKKTLAQGTFPAIFTAPLARSVVSGGFLRDR